MKKNYFEKVGFLYRFWYTVFIFIESILPFSLLKKYIFKKTESFSDKWVLVHTILSMISVVVVHCFRWRMLKLIIIIYAAIRILEIIIYQINVLLFHPYRALEKEGENKYELQSPHRSVVLLGHNFIEIILWFTAVSDYFSETKSSFLQIIMDNTIRVITFNYEIPPNGSSNLQYVIFAEVLCGIILVVISLAKFIGELPHVHLEFEEEEDH